MNVLSFLKRGSSLAGILLFTINAHALMPTHPAMDTSFVLLPGGKDLRTISVKGSKLSLTRGKGGTFSTTQQSSYNKIKNDSKTVPGYKMQWVFMDLDAHRVIDESLESNRKIFGASSSKIFVGAALLNKQAGTISSSQLQLMADMLVVSSNTAWTNLQTQVGDGSANTGRARIHAFTQGMGYLRTRGFQGYWGDMHGNELTAAETAEFLHDTYKGEYAGAETLWKLMHTYRTGGSRGEKYIPSNIYVGGKTGTYDGATVDPETGKNINVAVRNHVLVFNVKGRQYGLAILADTGSNESVSVLVGGLLREHAL